MSRCLSEEKKMFSETARLVLKIKDTFRLFIVPSVAKAHDLTVC